MIRTPRERFVNSAHLAAFKKLAQSECFEEATISAMLEMETETPLECTPQQAADAHQQMIGARKYLEFLCSYALPNPEKKPAAKNELDYTAGV